MQEIKGAFAKGVKVRPCAIGTYEYNISNIALWVRGFSKPKTLMIFLGELFPQQILIRNDIYVKIKILRKQSFNCHCIVTTHYHYYGN